MHSQQGTNGFEKDEKEQETRDSFQAVIHKNTMAIPISREKVYTKVLSLCKSDREKREPPNSLSESLVGIHIVIIMILFSGMR